MATLDLVNIHKSFGATKVLKDINIGIQHGEFVVFVGPSGCGKSTLLRIIAGLEDASAGSIRIDGQEVADMHPVQRGVAMVFQSYALYPHLNVFENIAFPLRVQRLPEDQVKQAVHGAAETLQLTDRLAFRPGQLSGGQRQRVAIGRAIVRNPKIFLFDEPLSNLDAALRGGMRVELQQLHQKLGATLIYVTHDQVEAMTMADRIVVMNHGVVEQSGAPMDLYNFPRNKFVAGFLGQPAMNFVPATVEGISAKSVTVQLNTGKTKIVLPVAAGSAKKGDAVEVGIRPEALSLGSGNGTVEATANVIEQLGGLTLVYGAMVDGTRLCASLPKQAKIAFGDKVKLSVDPVGCHLFDGAGLAFGRVAT